MRTTNNPYNKKVGLNVANNFLWLNTSKNSYLDLVFRNNEREAIGRRVLIMIYLLEGYTNTDIIEYLGCAKDTINSVKKDLRKLRRKDLDSLLKFLRSCYYAQFPSKSYRRHPADRLIDPLYVSKKFPNPEDRKVEMKY